MVGPCVWPFLLFWLRKNEKDNSAVGFVQIYLRHIHDDYLFFCVGMLLVCVLGKTISFAFLVQLPTSFQNLIS